MKAWLRRLPWIVLALLVVGAVVLAMMPRPQEVDLVAVKRGPLVATANEQGRTRIKEKYVVASPVTGHMKRVDLHAGDPVEVGKALTWIDPNEPDPLDERTRAQAERKKDAMDTARKREQRELERVRHALELAESELARAEAQSLTKSSSPQELESARAKARMAQDEQRVAELKVKIVEYEYEQAKAALIRARPRSPGETSPWRLDVTSPMTGLVLKVHQQSEGPVTPGTKILEVGDPTDLEIEVDLLTVDAVKVQKGARVIVDHWGGAEPLAARVRVVEPGGFMKVSALGVEEQRVWVISDFTDPLEKRAALKDGYRVEVRIVVWEGDNVLQVPSGALFRRGKSWAVFVAQEGKAVLREVQVGHTSGRETEILSGLSEGEQVLEHPSDKIKDGVSITPR